MNQFTPKQDVQLRLKIVEQGVLFLFHRPGGGGSELVQVDQSWSSVHSLVSRLRNRQKYCAQDHPLLIWKEGEELHIKFFVPDIQVAEECVFSGDETLRILTLLEKLPSMN